MYSAFEKQPQEKKDLILKVAIEEFVKNSYEKTSTDTITSRAGISKGILFHYFKSKKNLYVYLVSYCVDLLTEITMDALKKVKSDDFFERVKEIFLLKHEILASYMQETLLITDALLNPPVAVSKEMQEILNKHLEAYQKEFMLEHIYLKELIQTNRLREGISVDTVINMTMFIGEQLGNKYQTLYKNKHYDFFTEPDPLAQELNDYLEIVKNGVYK
ncbi:TetR/AcrR family transcriptional regulator [Bacillus sp. DTU_2020_1000418_1_SI_GHA_SEK_038]|uniref:TetR/AcrR family transcriptional regulator n=1 Tax=Bacillus sp. DTU_2020_1000418_1_SI_GHA_SEK_038 TaxID=3077585 RepID=UPI0028E9FE04|nr:TetR/AcrR family transcriptional regulator [Bacillus sp. DTU_2020_1000418_1_SI_GHA_SEK_038]WNS74902.1 TetR/AcrR family transcriptional regulator [Bacillus sp. DTU_2020_1000418_1_SI_GHA_SEK_038]